MTFQRTLLTLTAIALGLGAATQVQAAIIVTFPTPSTTGSIVVTNDIALEITANSYAQFLVFDGWVTSNGTLTFYEGTNISPALSYSLNGTQATVAWGGFVDNFSFTRTNITPDDGYFSFDIPFTVEVGNTFTLKAATYTLAAGSLPADFNPAAAQTFTGNAFLANLDGARLSANTPVGAIPEPGTAALGALAVGGLALRRRRA